MKVIFLEDVPGTADAGEVKEVKNGFARNYLLPQGLAAPATHDQLQRLRSIQQLAGEKRLEQTEDMAVVAKALEGTTVTIEGRVGPTGRLYGAVTSRHIAEELAKLTDRPLTHTNIHLGDAIHEPGDYPVTVHLYREVNAQVTVSVVPEGYLQEMAGKAAAGEAPPEAAPEEPQSVLNDEAPEAVEEGPPPEATVGEEEAEATGSPDTEPEEESDRS